MPRMDARILILTLAAATGCADGALAPKVSEFDPQLNLTGGGKGRLTVSDGSASGFREDRSEYHWTINKRVSQILAGAHMLPEASTTETVLELIKPDREQTKWIEYELQATRSGPTARSVVGARGRICVTNPNGSPTQRVEIATTIQQPGRVGYRDITTPRSIDVSAKPELAGGESYCYPFEISFVGSSDIEYRSVTVVKRGQSFRNDEDDADDEHDDDGAQSGGSALASDVRYVRIPSSAVRVVANASAHVWDGHGAQGNQMWATGGCAELWPLFQCTSDTDWGDWDFSATTTVHYMVDMHNLFACGASYVLRNRAVLTESGTGLPGAERQKHESTANLTLRTPECAPAHWCPRPVSDWRANNSIWPIHTLWGEQLGGRPFFDTGLSWEEMVRSHGKSAYAELAREYVAATLNLAKNAEISPSDRTTRNAAAHYFADDPDNRAAVSDRTLRDWSRSLKAFNQNRGSKCCRVKEHGDKGHKDDDHEGGSHEHER